MHGMLCKKPPENPSIPPPAIPLLQVTPRSLILHCSNLYSGLWASWLEGFVSEAATKLFGLADIQLQQMGGSDEGHLRQRTWRVCYPEQPLPPELGEGTPGNESPPERVVGLKPDSFYELFPFRESGRALLHYILSPHLFIPVIYPQPWIALLAMSDFLSPPCRFCHGSGAAYCAGGPSPAQGMPAAVCRWDPRGPGPACEGGGHSCRGRAGSMWTRSCV